jgi:hypothetical protein
VDVFDRLVQAQGEALVLGNCRISPDTMCLMQE